MEYLECHSDCVRQVPSTFIFHQLKAEALLFMAVELWIQDLSQGQLYEVVHTSPNPMDILQADTGMNNHISQVLWNIILPNDFIK